MKRKAGMTTKGKVKSRRPVGKKIPYRKPELERKDDVVPFAPDEDLFPERVPPEPKPGGRKA